MSESNNVTNALDSISRQCKFWRKKILDSISNGDFSSEKGINFVFDASFFENIYNDIYDKNIIDENEVIFLQNILFKDKIQITRMRISVFWEPHILDNNTLDAKIIISNKLLQKYRVYFDLAIKITYIYVTNPLDNKPGYDMTTFTYSASEIEEKEGKSVFLNFVKLLTTYFEKRYEKHLSKIKTKITQIFSPDPFSTITFFDTDKETKKILFLALDGYMQYFLKTRTNQVFLFVSPSKIEVESVLITPEIGKYRVSIRMLLDNNKENYIIYKRSGEYYRDIIHNTVNFFIIFFENKKNNTINVNVPNVGSSVINKNTFNFHDSIVFYKFCNRKYTNRKEIIIDIKKSVFDYVQNNNIVNFNSSLFTEIVETMFNNGE